jgi:hypothetical protein
VNMGTGFYMNSDNVSPSLSKLTDLMLWCLNHKVDIQREVCPTTNSSYYRGTNGYLGDKMPIHNIYMNVISASLSGFSYLLPKATEIGGENRWGKLDLRLTFHQTPLPQLSFAPNLKSPSLENIDLTPFIPLGGLDAIAHLEE